MQGFYTKEEAAHILGVSVRQINNYFSASKLSKVYQGKRAWIPQADVQALYDRASRGSHIKPEDIHDLQDRMERAELQIETLKMGLGFGSKRPSRSEVDMLTLRQRTLDALGKPTWRRRQMSDLSDELMTVQPEEVTTLIKSVGSMAWVPFCELAHRMLSYVEQHPEYPANGLDILQTKLIRARDRFYGLIYASSKTQMVLPPNVAERTYQAIQVPTNSIEVHIVEYLVAK